MQNEKTSNLLSYAVEQMNCEQLIKFTICIIKNGSQAEKEKAENQLIEIGRYIDQALNENPNI